MKLKLAILQLERQVLLFPVVVVLLACLGFLFGGRCAAWQWWTATGVALALPWMKRDGRAALSADALFVLLMIGLWLSSPMLCDLSCIDYQRCHFPTIHFLIEGWNPVCNPSSASFAASLGLDPDGLKQFHIDFIVKTASVFNACAFFCFRDPFALTVPVEIILFVGCSLSILRLFGVRMLACGALAVLLLFCALPEMFIDVSLMIASCGLIFTMYGDLRNRRPSWFQLFVYTFWMMNLKATGIFAAALMWILFAIAFCAKQKTDLRRTLARGSFLWGILFAAFAVVSFHPYGTSWRDFGHPLYPTMTSDPKTHPKIDLTEDFHCGNADVQRLGYVGEFFNAYVSPKLTRAFFNWKLGRDDFAPHRYVWDYSRWETVRMSPLDTADRALLWGTILLLLLFRETRPFGLMAILSLFLFPRRYMGFMRYTPWLQALGVLAAAHLLQRVLHGRPQEVVSKPPLPHGRAALCRGRGRDGARPSRGFATASQFKRASVAVVGLACAVVGYRLLTTLTYQIRSKHEVAESRPKTIYTCYLPPWPPDPKASDKTPHPSHNKTYHAAALLARRAHWHDTQIIDLPSGATNGFQRVAFGYYLPEGTWPPVWSNEGSGLSRKLDTFWKCWVEIYPKAIFKERY